MNNKSTFEPVTKVAIAYHKSGNSRWDVGTIEFLLREIERVCCCLIEWALQNAGSGLSAGLSLSDVGAARVALGLLPAARMLARTNLDTTLRRLAVQLIRIE